MSTFKLRSSYGALALGVASLACGGDEKLGSVMLAISTDLYIDKDVSRVDIIVQPEHGPTQQTQFNLAPGLDGQYLPGTFAIIEGSTPGEFLRVRIVARQGSFARVVREAALRVPRQRTALLSMPIQWLCDGHVRQEGQVTRSNCEEGETCSKGACAPDAVDETTLPDYEAAAVFGGGDPTGGGECFDTVPCFEINSEPALDLDTCVLDTEVTDDLNIGIRLPVGSAGHCSNAECWVPLDASAQSGWEPIEGGGRVQLPPAVCGHVRDEGASVRVSHECASKASSTPTCGPWTLVGAEPGGDGNIDGAPLTVTTRTLATELQTAAARLSRRVANACASITQVSAPTEPTPAQVTQLCDAARSAIAAQAPLDWYHVTTQCWPDHARQFACERACDESCEPGTVVDRCEPAVVAGKCDDACDSRQCLGTPAQPVNCPGACDGTCSGACGGLCVGQCDGECDAMSEDGYCAGRCTGTCTGLCQGRCEGTCQGHCDGDPNLPVAACTENSQCRGGCAGTYEAPVCNSPLTDSPCGLDAECAADCRGIGAIGVACEPAVSWVLPKNGLAPAARTAIARALGELIPVRDVEAPALLQEAGRVAERLQATAATSGDALGAANALLRVRAAAALLDAAGSGAVDVVESAGEPRDTPGGANPGVECTPTQAGGSRPLIDDFEDGNSQILTDEGRNGSWHLVRDNSVSGQLSLDEPPVPYNEGANQSSHAMHLSGSNFTEWGAGLSVDLRQQSLPYDASAYVGLKFWARGAQPLRLILIQQDLATGGSCTTCSSADSNDCGLFYGAQVSLTENWTQYTVPWGALSQSAAGSTAFAPDQLMLLKFEVQAAEQFEFWLDDVSFY